MAKGKHFDYSKLNMLKIKAICFRLIALFLIVCLLIVIIKNNSLYAYLTAKDSRRNSIKLAGLYTVKFDANGGQGTMADQLIFQNVNKPLSENKFYNNGHTFSGWNTSADGSGTSYSNCQSVLNIGNTTLYAQWNLANGVAEVNGVIYPTLKDAINSVSKNGTLTIVRLLCSTAEIEIKVKAGQNIKLDLQNNTLNNVSASDIKSIIENSGELEIVNGTIANSSGKGAVDNTKDKHLKINNVEIRAATGQAIYNNGGILEVSNGTHIITSSSGRIRPLIQNIAGGTITISDSTIENLGSFSGSSDHRNTTILNRNAGTLYLSNVNINSINAKVIHNDENSIATISGNSNLSSAAPSYSTIVNNSGTLNVLGGSIISTSSGNNRAAIDNMSTLVIGDKDGDVDKTSPVIQGIGYGINSSGNNTSTISFYDGVVRGCTHSAFNSETYIIDKEENNNLVHKNVMINDVSYHEVFLGNVCYITLNTEGGSVEPSTTTIECEIGEAIGDLPIPTRKGYSFLGWFDAETDGNLIDSSSVFNADTTIFAHWKKTAFVRANGIEYDTLQEAINSVPNGVETTVTLLQDVRENFQIPAGKEVILDLNGFELSNARTDKPIINNYGKITTLTGTLRANSTLAGAIDNMHENARVIVDGANIITTGGRQAIYNEKGYVEIRGNSYLSSAAVGIKDDQTLPRATINNCRAGTLAILGGVIECSTQSAVSNSGTLIVGVQDGNSDSTNPVFKGNDYGIRNDGTFEYYDGIIKGKIAAIDGAVAAIENNCSIINSTEIISDETYYTAHQESNE